MADEQQVDPQYLWITPKYLELTETARLQLPPNIFPLNFKNNLLTYLDRLIHIGDYRGIYIDFRNKEDEEAAQSEYNRFMGENKILDGRLSFPAFYCEKPLWDALTQAGLGFKGTLAEFMNLTTITRDSNSKFPMQRVLIIDAENARKYVNIGFHIGTDIPEHPFTLDEAASAYAKISALVDDTTLPKDVEKIGESSQTSEGSSGGDDDDGELWGIQRDEFKKETKRRYRQLLLDMAKEEWLEDQPSGLREKKRARLDGA